MNPQYASAVAAAAASQAGLGGSPNGDAGNIQHLQNLAQLQFRGGQTQAAVGGLSGDASNVASNNAAAASASAAAADNSAKATEIQRAAKAKFDASMVDPNNYTRTVAKDGGYNFFNPAGQPITVAQYSQATGKQIPESLKGSNNQNDSQFTKDYQTLLTYGHAMTGDQAALDKFKSSPEGTAFLSNKDNKNKTYAEVVNDFSNHYGSYMQPQQLNTINPVSNGVDHSNDILGGTQAGWLSDFLNGTRQGVTYR